MLRRALPLLLSAVVVVMGLAALVVRPEVEPPRRTADYVVIAGATGMSWGDIDPDNTPNLWRLAERGSIGSLSVRSARRPTCPVDGWLTLGAGNYASWYDGAPGGVCRPLEVAIEEPDGIGANLPDQRSAVLHNKEKLPWGAVPGALAESVRCTVAVGPGAAVAAARPFGRVDRYESTLPADPADLLGSCVLSIVDLGVVTGDDPAQRARTARQVDAALARVLAARPERSLVLVAGLADSEQSSGLHPAIADGPGWEGGWLTSGSTNRDGYLQLVDLAPTALAALGRSMPELLFTGQAADTVSGRPADLPTAIALPADADREARAQRRVATGFFGLLAGVQFLLAVAVLPLLRRARPQPGPAGPIPVPNRILAAVELLLIAAALAIPVALLADAVPWWRTDYGGLLFAAVAVLLLALVTAGVRLARPYRTSLGPMGMVAGLAAVVVGADVVTGARLQLNGVAGYSAIEGGRYTGLGTVGLGVFIAGVMLSAACLAQRVRRGWRPTVLVLVGGVGVVVVGSPYLGSDPVGAIALTAGVSIAAAIATGGWLTFARLAWAAMAGLAVTGGFAVLELRQPSAERSGLARFLSDLADGTGGLVIARTGTDNLAALVGSPLPMLAIVGAVLVWFALLRPWGGLNRLFGLYPAVRAGMIGVVVAALIGGLLGGTGLDVAGAAAALAVPVAALTALRVLSRSTDRTCPPTPTGEDPAASAAGAAQAGPGSPAGEASKAA
ncbi:MAG TPA: hypothetical protein VFX61_10940 [Micromonosporaceae bacterium]|nr:hypothetical protein [Micromonosporaceae bacterium]